LDFQQSALMDALRGIAMATNYDSDALSFRPQIAKMDIHTRFFIAQ
jgi:hypothetical protein